MQLKTLQNQQPYLNHRKRLPCQPSQSGSEQQSQYESDGEGERAIQEFRRQIQERFKISVANKLYSFPRRVLTASDLISSDQQSSDEQSQNKSNEEQPQTQALRPISKVQLANKSHLKQQDDKQKQKHKPFKRKQIYYVGDKCPPKNKQQPITVSNFDNRAQNKQLKLSKMKKKPGKSKQKSKDKKQQSFRVQRQKQTNRSKRFNTEPDSYNYLQTLRSKNRR